MSLSATAAPHETLWGYVRLGKLWVYHHWIPVLIAWALVPAAARDDGGVIGTMLLMILAVIAVAASGSALDDYQGKRDGLDDATYGANADLRTLKRKPLVTGDVSLPGALWFGRLTAVLGGLAAVGAFAVAPHLSLGAVLGFAAICFLGTQYSYGLKFSYHGMGELVLGLCTAGTTAVPFALATGGFTDTAAIQSILVGGYMWQVSICSNSNDREDDRATGRRTPASMLSEEGNRIYVACVFLVSWALSVGGIAAGVLPLELALTFIPCWVVQVRQLMVGVGQRHWLGARVLGWRAYELGVLGMVVANLVAY